MDIKVVGGQGEEASYTSNERLIKAASTASLAQPKEKIWMKNLQMEKGIIAKQKS